MKARLSRLYKAGRLNMADIAAAVARGWITSEEAAEITGETV
ncbi:MAG: XkdX family protein [Butyricicoccus sp.]|nr:XkdX family protein [Butyricicoccus sp.]